MPNPGWTPYVAFAGFILAFATFAWNVGREFYDRRRSIRVGWEAGQTSGGIIDVSIKLTNLSPKADVEIDQVRLVVNGERLARIDWRKQLARRLAAGGIVRITGLETELVPAGEDLLRCDGIEAVDSRGRTCRATKRALAGPYCE
jgi:hypothetical protein